MATFHRTKSIFILSDTSVYTWAETKRKNILSSKPIGKKISLHFFISRRTRKIIHVVIIRTYAVKSDEFTSPSDRTSYRMVPVLLPLHTSLIFPFHFLPSQLSPYRVFLLYLLRLSAYFCLFAF